MFAKRLLHKALRQVQRQKREGKGIEEMDVQISVHYGIPYAASILAYDPIQGLLAIGTLDGRIKIIGGNNIEGLLISPKQLPFKYLQFIQNHGIIVAISNENEIQVWNLEFRQLFCCLHWELNITSFAVAQETQLMYLGDEYGSLSVLKYGIIDGKLNKLPYNLPVHAVYEAAGVSFLDPQAVVGVLPQPHSFGSRILLAYEKGLLVLWDLAEDKAIAVRGSGALQLKSGMAGSQGLAANDEADKMLESEENEICSLCWASSSGSLVAVGYINGDILLWNVASKDYRQGKPVDDTSSNVVKLQLASANRRLPVIVLHWSPNSTGDSDLGGHLFVYGGDDIGSEEVLTVLTLQWSSGMVRCISRSGLRLNGSFADMVLIPQVAATQRSPAGAIFVLTNPGQLNIFDGALLYVQKSEQNTMHPIPHKFPASIPTADPDMTCAKLYTLTSGSKSSKIFMKKFHSRHTATSFLSDGVKWPLTGGVPSKLSLAHGFGVERIYIAGYQDGTVLIWDATFPIFICIFELGGKVSHIENIDGGNVSISALEFCAETMTLAAGNGSGLVRIFKLHENTEGSSFHFVSDNKTEAHIMHHGKGFHCNIAFLALDSPVRVLQFTNSGDKLAVGFENGQVAVFDLNALSVIYSIDCASGTNSPVISIKFNHFHANVAPVENTSESSPNTALEYPSEVMICLAKDTRISMLDSSSGAVLSSQLLCPNHLAISMYVIDRTKYKVVEVDGELPSASLEISNEMGEPKKVDPPVQKEPQQMIKDDVHLSDGTLETSAVICCDETVILLSLMAMLKGDASHLQKVDITRNCWSVPFKTNSDVWKLISLNQNGAMEIRSLPELELVAESSLMSILRWSYKIGMEKTMSSANGQISVVNGSELAVLSLLDSENDFRIPQSLPSLHDKELAAAAEAAANASRGQKKKQDPASGILGDIIKVLRSKVAHDAKLRDDLLGYSPSQLMEFLLSRDPYADAIDIDLSIPDDLNIDDIDIDDASPESSKNRIIINTNKKSKAEDEREKLFEGATDTEKPRMRTTEEIMTKYKFGGDAAAAAAHARDKLVQRQEKLDRISQRTAELQSGAENFSNLAHELAKKMENKKWWQL